LSRACLGKIKAFLVYKLLNQTVFYLRAQNVVKDCAEARRGPAAACKTHITRFLSAFPLRLSRACRGKNRPFLAYKSNGEKENGVFRPHRSLAASARQPACTKTAA
jgi:hypothetical protein